MQLKTPKTMGGGDAPSALAWLWVVEALSAFKQITPSTVLGLIGSAPVKADEVSETTRELVALRCLEELSARLVGPDASSTLDSRVGLVSSRGSEDVLGKILSEIPLSNLKMARAELLKQDVYSFVNHKRADTSKCHLKQLKELILEGTHPHADYMKERSGLFHQNSLYTVPVSDGKHDDHSDKGAGNSADAKNMGEKENSVSLILENGNEISKKDMHDNNFSPSKRSRVFSADDHLTGHLHEKQVYINECDDFNRNSKRIKCYASTNFESNNEKTVFQPRQEVSEHLTERTLQSSGQGKHHAENNKMETLGDAASEDSHNICSASKLLQSSGHIEVFNDEVDQLLNCDANVVHPVDEADDTSRHAIQTHDSNAEKNQHMINLDQPKQKEPDITPLNLSQKHVASDKTIIVDLVNGCGPQLSSDSDGNHNEKEYFEAKKHEFLQSHCTVDQEFSPRIGSTEQNLCMKCNRGGQLLACKTTTCSLMVHKNCLDAAVQLDAKGNLFCPYCAYSQAISGYLEAKKYASFARKELAIFISKGIQNQDAELVHDFPRQEHCFSRKNSKYEHTHLKNKDDGELIGCEGNKEGHVGEHPNEADNLQFENSEQQAPISCRENEILNNESVEVLRREEEMSETPNAKSLSGEIVEQTEVSTDHEDGHVGDKFTCEKINIAPVNHSDAGEEVQQETTKQHNVDGTVEAVCAHDTGKEEISKDECEKHSAHRYSMRFRKHETQCKPHASPVFQSNQFRRRKIPWTAEEEELIREGVKKFGLNDPKKWRKILAFGSCVFETVGKRRTPQDLKDKWRNMCKAHSKSK